MNAKNLHLGIDCQESRSFGEGAAGLVGATRAAAVMMGFVLGGCTLASEEPGPSGAAREVSQALASSHMIANVPWHEQQNALFCGPASLAMMLDHWGPTIDQKPITNVARTASAGTWCPDMVRTGHFSWNSAAQGNYFPNHVPTAGFPERALGYGAFEHSQDAPWLDGLKAAIASDVPVVALVTFEADGGSGHFRVAVGYDDALGVIYLLDPWGRDQNRATGSTGLFAWTYADFLGSWNYQDALNDHPHWAAAIVPWSVSLSVQGSVSVGSKPTVTANVSYRCPPSFDCDESPASNVLAELALPVGMTLVQGSASTSLANLSGGASVSTTWKIKINAPAAGKKLSVRASGWVSGNMPAAPWNGQSNSYPPYAYSDQIGGSGEYTF